MMGSGLQNREQAYRDASRAFEYFVTGLSSVLFLATTFTYEVDPRPFWSVLDAAAIILFALAVVAGLKKLEYTVAVLGADYSIALTESNQANLTVRESTGVVRDLNETVERLSNRAAVVHSFRNWLLVLGILTLIASRLLRTVQAF